jgi:hypothetical protein
VLALQCFGARPEHPEIEASMALSRIRELSLVGRQPLTCVLPEQLVQLEAAEPGSAHEGLAHEPMELRHTGSGHRRGSIPREAAAKDSES